MPFKRMGSVLFKRQPLRRVSDQTGHQVLIAGGAGIHRDRRHIRAVPEAAERGIFDRQGQCGVERYGVSKIVGNGGARQSIDRLGYVGADLQGTRSQKIIYRTNIS